jgi:hypothetical protein
VRERSSTCARASTARSTQQAIAIGLSKARRAGVKLAPPKRWQQRHQARGAPRQRRRRRTRKVSKTRSRAVTRALKREPRSTVTRGALAPGPHGGRAAQSG